MVFFVPTDLIIQECAISKTSPISIEVPLLYWLSPTQPLKTLCGVWMSVVLFLFLWKLGAVLLNRCWAEAVRGLQKVTFINNQSLSSPVLPCSSSGLQGCRRFQSSAVNYSTMLLEADSQRLYVGARGAVFALNASDISASPALTVSLFVSVLLCVVCLSCHIFNSSTASFELHNTGTFRRQQYFILRQKYLFPHRLLCICVCVAVTLVSAQ